MAELISMLTPQFNAFCQIVNVRQAILVNHGNFREVIPSLTSSENPQGCTFLKPPVPQTLFFLFG